MSETNVVTLRRTDGSVIWEGEAWDRRYGVISALQEELSLAGADLRGIDLSYLALSGVRMRGVKLDDGFPVIPDIHAAVYAAAAAPDALDMDEWHACDTTHCRAGWVVTLAGEAGKELELLLGTSTAAAVIYMASDPELEQIPDWYTHDDAALADMARLAGVQ